MGIASVPYEDLKTAKKFKQKMSKPWVCKVVHDKEYNDYYCEDNGYSLFFSSDDLGMYLDEVAQKKKKSFDIRKYMKEILKPTVEWESCQLESQADRKALNIVREALALKPLPQDGSQTPVQKTFQYIIDKLEEEKCVVESNELYVIKNAKPWSYNAVNIPKKYLGKNINYGRVRFKKAKSPKTAIKGLKFVFEKEYDSKYKELKIFFKAAPVSDLKVAQVQEKLRKESVGKKGQKSSSSKNGGKTPKKILLHNKEGKSDKFWKAEVVKNELRVEFGRTVSQGRKNVKKFKDPAEALVALEKKIQEKKKKGYK